MNQFQPDVVIHSAAERSVDVIEKNPELAKKINLDGTHNVCEAAGSWKLTVQFRHIYFKLIKIYVIITDKIYIDYTWQLLPVIL